MLPKPRADLKPNTADFERLPLVKPTGFREYDARWLFPTEINLMGLNAIGLGIATLAAKRGRPKRFVVGHDYRSYSASVKQAADQRPAGRRRRGARHRPGAVADGLLRPVRARGRRRGDGHGQPQRQRLDRHQDGHEPPADVRAGRDDRAEGDRARRRRRAGRRRPLHLRARHRRTLHRRPDRPAQAEAPPQGGVRLRQRHGRRLRAAGAGGARLRGGAARLRPRLHLPALQPEP